MNKFNITLIVLILVVALAGIGVVLVLNQKKENTQPIQNERNNSQVVSSNNNAGNEPSELVKVNTEQKVIENDNDIDTSNWQVIEIDRSKEWSNINAIYSFKLPHHFEENNPGSSIEGGQPVVYKYENQEVWFNVGALGTNADVEFYRNIINGNLNNPNIINITKNQHDIPIINSEAVNNTEKNFTIISLNPENEYSILAKFSNIQDEYIDAILNSFIFK